MGDKIKLSVKLKSNSIKKILNHTIMRINRRLKLRPSSDPFLSSDTFRSLADLRYDETMSSFEPKKIRNRDIIFLKTDYLVSFIDFDLPCIKTPFILITHQSDINITYDNSVGNMTKGSLVNLLNSPFLLHWFAQNCLITHPKITPLPLGLEDRRHYDKGDITDFRLLRKKRNLKRLPLVAYGFTIETNPTERLSCYHILKSLDIAQALPKGLDSPSYRRYIMRYMFVASPPGNGIDCHRTWEAMYLGVIPIVLKNAMHESFYSRGLPLVMIENWQELSTWTTEYVEALYEKKSKEFDSSVLWQPYWKELFMKIS